MLLLRAVDAELLDNYAEMVRDLHARYTSEVWFVLYTAEVRMRSERFERLRRTAEGEHVRALAAGRESGFEPARPWNRVFADAVADRDWWGENFTEPAILYRTRIQTAAAAVGEVAALGDAPGGRGVKRPLPAAGSWGKERGTEAVWANGGYVKNKKGVVICEAFNRGQCGSPTGVCPRGEAHQCRLCLASHTPDRCRLPPPPPPLPFAGKGGEKGKGGKGGKKGAK
eukprot:13253131-Heterocapsa_arctica.AAC.1